MDALSCELALAIVAHMQADGSAIRLANSQLGERAEVNVSRSDDASVRAISVTVSASAIRVA
jgi:hypothetical protein